MKMQTSSIEALMALIFAICVLVALFLLTSCGERETSAPEAHPNVSGQSIAFVPTLFVQPTLYRAFFERERDEIRDAAVAD